MSVFCLCFWKTILLDLRFSCECPFSFQHVEYAVLLPLASVVSGEESTVNLMGFPVSVFSFQHFQCVCLCVSCLSNLDVWVITVSHQIWEIIYLLFRWHKLYQPVFKWANSPASSKSAVELLYWIFHLSSCFSFSEFPLDSLIIPDTIDDLFDEALSSHVPLPLYVWFPPVLWTYFWWLLGILSLSVLTAGPSQKGSVACYVSIWVILSCFFT